MITSKASPVVSVLVTVYKRTTFLKTAIQSVLNQTFRDFEIILLDDSGSHLAKSVYEPFLSSGKIRYHANLKTIGVAESLRAGIANSNAEFISILNDDDFWEPEFLARLLPPLQADERRFLAFSDHWIADADGKVDFLATEENTVRYGRANLPEGDVSNLPDFVLIKNGVPLAMASVFRKRALDLRLLNSKVAGAYDFWISCALSSTGGKFYFVPQRLTSWRLHLKMETGRRSPDKSDCMVFIISQILDRAWFPEMKDQLVRKLSDSWFRSGLDYSDFGQVALALHCFVKAFLTKPSFKTAVKIVLYIPQKCFKTFFGYIRAKLFDR